MVPHSSSARGLLLLFLLAALMLAPRPALGSAAAGTPVPFAATCGPDAAVAPRA